MEMGPDNFDKVMEICKDLIERRYEINSANPGGGAFEKVAKVYNRMASVCERRKDYAQGIEYLNKALTEDNNKQTRNALRELEAKKDKAEKDAYIDQSKRRNTGRRAMNISKHKSGLTLKQNTTKE